MMVWLWEAGKACGVSDDDVKARDAAEAFMHAGQASSLRVEGARLLTGANSLYTGYMRLGRGWTGVARQGGPVRWRPLEDEPAGPGREKARGSDRA